MQYIRLVGDWETFYSPKEKYSLRNLDPPSYILDPRFEEIGCAFKMDGGKTIFVDGPDIPRYLKDLGDPSRVMFINHNTLFDASIASWRHGWVAGMYVDTLSLSRALLGHLLPRLSLDYVATYYGLPPKGKAIAKVADMRRADIIASGLYKEYAEYSCLDADLCWELFLRLAPAMPASELVIADMVQRMAIEPVLKLDPVLLHEHLANVQAEKASLLFDAGFTNLNPDGTVNVDDLMSNDKFAAALQGRGVEPPVKVSALTGQETYAFAKTDEDFKALLEHYDPAVQALVAARMGVKSTIEETRTKRFINISGLNFPAYGTNLFPIALKVAGAHTHRLCLAGDTTIVALRDKRVVYIRLDNLAPTDLVWDGGVFVEHGGLAYAGYKEVITYDGITGTPDHRVWTVEYGYRQLAEAKARGYHIARGDIPDPARIDPALQRRDKVQHPHPVYLRAMQEPDGKPVERFTYTYESVVPALYQARANGRQAFHSESYYSGGANKPGRSCPSTSVASSVTYEGNTIHARNYSFASQSFIKKMAGPRLARGNACCATSLSTLHQPKRNELRVLRWAGDNVRVCVDGCHGRLAAAEFRGYARGSNFGSYQGKWPLRTRQSQMVDLARTDEKPQFVATWDIVDCGPRNCFMANGKIVHNSGDWKMNAQNMARASRKRPRAMLRESILAPEGYLLVVGDESQIEARMNGCFAGQWDLVEQFERGEDPYSIFATKVFGYSVSKATPNERFIGKTAILSAGYGVGWEKYQASIRHLSKEQTGTAIVLSDYDAQRHINLYRQINNKIKDQWYYANNVVIPAMARTDTDFMWGPIRVMHEKLVGPNGLCLNYRGLHRNPTSGDWLFVYGNRIKKIYGGKLIENVIQFLARIVIMEAALRLKKPARELGCKLVLQCHDELGYVAPVGNEIRMKDLLELELRRRPTWMPRLPLNCEIGIGKNYGEAK